MSFETPKAAQINLRDSNGDKLSVNWCNNELHDSSGNSFTLEKPNISDEDRKEIAKACKDFIAQYKNGEKNS